MTLFEDAPDALIGDLGEPASGPLLGVVDGLAPPLRPGRKVGRRQSAGVDLCGHGRRAGEYELEGPGALRAVLRRTHDGHSARSVQSGVHQADPVFRTWVGEVCPVDRGPVAVYGQVEPIQMGARNGLADPPLFERAPRLDQI